MLSSPSSHPTSSLPLPWVTHRAASPRPGAEGLCGVSGGSISAAGCFVTKSPARWQARGASPFQIHKINAVLYSRTFKHQTGNLSSFTAAERRKEPGQIK